MKDRDVKVAIRKGSVLYGIASIMLLLAGAMCFVMSIMGLKSGAESSQYLITDVAYLNNLYAGLDPYPDTGVRYTIEARIVDNVNGDAVHDRAWYRGAIFAKPGDIIQARLKIAAADPKDIDQQINLLPAISDGLVRSTVITLDEPSASYAEKPFDEHIRYINIGYYELTRKGWLSRADKSVPEMTLHVKADRDANLIVVWPYCKIDIVEAIVFFGCAIVLWMARPCLKKAIKKRIRKKKHAIRNKTSL